MRTEVITTYDGLASLEAEWWKLFARTPSATPFSSPAWLLPWEDVFRPGALFAVAIWQGDALLALAPLYSEQGRYGRRLLPLGIGISDYMDLLIDPTAPAAGAALQEAIAAGAEHWDVWRAEEASPNAAVLALAAGPAWTIALERQSACPVLPLTATPSGCIPARQQRKWRMAQNRTARRTWSMTSTSPATLADDLAHLFRLHGARWEARGQAGVLADDAVRRFHAAAAPRLLAAGLLRLSVLRIDGVVAGVYYGLQRETAAFAYLGGFDPAFAFESPGTVLLGAAIEAAIAAGAKEFHFLRGQEPYKYAWGAVDRWNSCRTFAVKQ